jgi:branched-chain amino acid transport system ATP-binding protein
MPPSRSSPTGLVHCPEGRKLFPAMSVLKNLTLGAYVHRRDKAGIQKLAGGSVRALPHPA